MQWGWLLLHQRRGARSTWQESRFERECLLRGDLGGTDVPIRALSVRPRSDLPLKVNSNAAR